MPARQNGARILRALRDRLIRANSGPAAGFPVSRSGLAFLVALATIAFLTFVVFPARHITVVADGVSSLVHSREQSDAAILRRANVTLELGDRVLHQTDRRDDPQLQVSRATPIVAEVSGRLVYWRTQAKTLGGALSEIGVTLNDGDQALVNGVLTSPRDPLLPLAPRTVASALSLMRFPSPALSDQHPLSVTVKRAAAFTVLEDGHSLSLRSTQPTLAEALKENDIVLGPADLVSPDPQTPLTAGLSAEVDHASRLTITLPEGTSVVYSHEKTVGAALEASGIGLTPLDKVSPARDEPLTRDMEVEVIRVTVGDVVERDEIPFQTVFRGDPDLSWGDSRRVEGQAGVHASEYQVTYEDGQETGRALVRDWVEQEPQDAVVYYSAASEASAGIADGTQVVEVKHVYATWYDPASAGKPRSSSGYGYTSTGVQVTRGVVAVDPSVIPYGTKMFIPGYGFAVAADCGGGVNGNMIDLGFPDDYPVDWSPHWVDIYILG
ncbi:MAG: ubiquitin-like domain-containing protein [Dehalococcoidia bacterium]